MTIYDLQPHPKFKKYSGPVVLIIMDGVGIGAGDGADAVAQAHTPVLDELKKTSLYTELKAHGKAVGMPTDADMGNSEVGHNALGAGRIFDQGAALVKDAIDSRALFNGAVWQEGIAHCRNGSHTLHFIGLLSDGNVHSHIDHLLKMLEEAQSEGVSRVRIHILTDGRDVAGRSALGFIDKLERVLATINQSAGFDYRIASGGGRMVITMDRYNADWDMVKRGWQTHVLGEGRHFHSATEAVETIYSEDANKNDQYLDPFVIVDANDQPLGAIQDGDAVILFNYRGDRAIELSMAFENDDFDKFDRVRRPKVWFAGMMEYDGDLHIPAKYLVSPPAIAGAVSCYLCHEGIRSFAISETQKYGHVTFFWNGNRSGYVDKTLETYIEIPSDRIPFEQRPEMKAYQITEKTIELLQSGNYDFGRINFPNGDMVGHTGVFDAAVKAVEVTDECVGKIVDCVKALDGLCVVLADHGNSDEMFTVENGVKIPKTSHTLNPVPCYIVDAHGQHGIKLAQLDSAGLANVAATLCNLLGFEAPNNYEPSLILHD